MGFFFTTTQNNNKMFNKDFGKSANDFLTKDFPSNFEAELVSNTPGSLKVTSNISQNADGTFTNSIKPTFRVFDKADAEDFTYKSMTSSLKVVVPCCNFLTPRVTAGGVYVHPKFIFAAGGNFGNAFSGEVAFGKALLGGALTKVALRTNGTVGVSYKNRICEHTQMTVGAEVDVNTHQHKIGFAFDFAM